MRRRPVAGEPPSRAEPGRREVVDPDGAAPRAVDAPLCELDAFVVGDDFGAAWKEDLTGTSSED